MRLNIFNPQEQKNVKIANYKKQGSYTMLTTVCIVVILVLISIFIYNSVKNGNCLSIESSVMDAAMRYAEENDLLPKYEGENVTIDISELDTDAVVFKGGICTGTVVITKAEGNYVKTFDLQNCNYCTTSKRYKWSKASTKIPNNKSLVSVEMLFNYYDISYNYTPWTDWFASEEIDVVPSDYNGIKMPLDTKKWPTIPNAGQLVTYETEQKTFYSYRDKKWKFYQNQNNDYSDFSSTRPAGYTYRDDQTKIETEPSEWSTNYPDEYDYRTITSKKGYKWYYENEQGNKIYYNDGKFTPEIKEEDLKELYNKKEKDTVTMYSYVDSLWRWYNGTPRKYSGYRTEPTSSYLYKDEGLIQYTSWTRWSETSQLNSSNQSYREQRTDTHQRYRAYYTIHSNEKLANYLNLEDFERRTGRTLEEMQMDENIQVLIQYQYRYGK